MADPADNAQAASSLKEIRQVLLRESDALRSLSEQIDSKVDDAVEQLLNCRGRIVVTGMGKMGWVGRKATSTFCSTGAPSIFLHPTEAVHGDLGVVTEEDVVLALSNSGETDELNSLLPHFRRLGVPIISLSGNNESTLGKYSDVTINICAGEEADPISLAPTTSTTVTMAMCDALAIALMQRRGFTKEQFAIFHPGGNLGRKLLLKTADVMHAGQAMPVVNQTASLREALLVISNRRLGCTAVVEGNDNHLIGFLTDGDLRRSFTATPNPLEESVQEHMTRTPATIAVDSLAAEALHLMEERKITMLPVVDEQHRIVGIVHMHDLIEKGLA